ncbi:MAG TPA: hypothetical protein VIJ29_04115 [Candidatus Paceibacterota bacterium]
MRYEEPNVPSPEMRMVGYAARELFRKKKADLFLLVVNTAIRGYWENEISSAFLRTLGIPAEAIVSRPSADTTDGEFEVFKKYMSEEHPGDDASVIAIEAKKQRMELIATRSDFHPHIYYAEDLAAGADDPNVASEVDQWRRSFRHTEMRIRLGIIPLLFMRIDPDAKIARYIAKMTRHQG